MITTEDAKYLSELIRAGSLPDMPDESKAGVINAIKTILIQQTRATVASLPPTPDDAWLALDPQCRSAILILSTQGIASGLVNAAREAAESEPENVVNMPTP